MFDLSRLKEYNYNLKEIFNFISQQSNIKHEDLKDLNEIGMILNTL